MYLIKKFRDFFGKINEIDASGTYLDPNKFRGNLTEKPTSITGKIPPVVSKVDANKTSMARLKYGKIFAQAPKTADKNWDLEFKLIKDDSEGKVFRVIFPDDFIEYFKSILTSDDLESNSKSFSQSTDSFKPQRPLPIDIPDSSKDVVFTTGNKLKWEELDDLNIASEHKFNRTHFPSGIPDEFKGIGLGYIIYEEFIKFLGYASSNQSASDEAQKVWSQIVRDPDFYAVVIKKSNIRYGNVFVIHKDCKKSSVESELIEWMKGMINQSSYRGIIIDENIYKKYPNLEAYRDIWNYETRQKLKDIPSNIQEVCIAGDIDKLIELVNIAQKYKFVIQSAEEHIIKNILQDFISNPSKLDFYKVVFEKLLSSEVLTITTFIMRVTYDSWRFDRKIKDNFIEHLFTQLKSKKYSKEFAKLVSDSELKQKILSS